MKVGEEYLWDFETTLLKVRVLSIIDDDWFSGYIFESKDKDFPINTINKFAIKKSYWKLIESDTYTKLMEIIQNKYNV